MGVSSDGLLVFGIDLGEELPEPWQAYEDFDFDDYLAESAGHPAWRSGMTDEESGAYHDQKWKIIEAAPVTLEEYCSYDFPMYILSIPETTIRVNRGDVEEIKPIDLVVPREKIDAMKAWCEEHKIQWSEPKWLLCSMYG